MAELEAAAHSQGFASLDEVERAVLEPGATIAFIGRKLSPEVERHVELPTRLDKIAVEVETLRTIAGRTKLYSSGF